MKKNKINALMFTVFVLFVSSSLTMAQVAKIKKSINKEVPKSSKFARTSKVQQELKPLKYLGTRGVNAAGDTADFEGNTFPNYGWTIEYTDVNYWTQEISNGPCRNGSKAARFDCWNAVGGVEQSIVSPLMTAVNNVVLCFDVAHAPYSYYNSMENDSLTVLSSTDGVNFTSLLQLSGNQGVGVGIQTAEAEATSFIPNSDQWATILCPLPAGTVKYKLKVTSGYGNEIWIDNIHLATMQMNDLMLSALIVPQGILLPDNHEIKAVVKNFGIVEKEAGVNVTFKQGNTVLGTVATTKNLMYLETDTVSFTWNVSTAGKYNISAELPTDDHIENNSFGSEIYIENQNYMFESFELGFPPEDWSSEGSWGGFSFPPFGYDQNSLLYCTQDTGALIITPLLQVNNGDYIAFHATTWAKSLWPSVKIMYSTDKNNWSELSGIEYTLNNSYVRIHETILLTGQYYFAISCTNGSFDYALVDMLIAPPKVIFPINAGVVSIKQLANGCSLSVDTLEIEVKNYGYNPISNIPVSYIINEGNPVFDTVRTTLQAGESYIFQFEELINLSTPGVYTISARTQIENDGNENNDEKITYTESIQSSEIPYSSNFEDQTAWLGWTTEDSNNDQNTWMWGFGSGFNSGSSAMASSWDVQSDDWLFSTCVDLNASINYNLSFYLKVNDATTVDKMEIKIGTANNSLAMLNTLLAQTTFTDTAFTLVSINFTVPTSETYFIGFHDISDPFMWGVYIDSLNISSSTNVSNVKANSKIEMYPNPSNDIIYFTNSNGNEISIINSIGQEVMHEKIDNANNSINISNIAEGNYILKIFDKENVYTKKLAIIRN